MTFKPDVGDPPGEADRLLRAHGGQMLHTYSHAVKGFAARLPDAAVQALQNNPNIERIEQDQTVSLQLASPQGQATWGLDRIDQVNLPTDTSYNFTRTGAGVTAFIVDSGVRSTHIEFYGRMLSGFTSVNDGNGTNDCNGHGTHVAGTVAGTTWGVAKQAYVVPVRVLDCAGSGTWSGVIAGVDWVAASPRRPAVANMSLGGGYSASVNAAVAGAIAKGVSFAVAAGNSNVDACNTSPASERSAITVAATTNTDARASYSNWGSCVDLFAPGSAITSTWHTGDSATNIISGTSMASPHVAGASALVLQSNPGASPAAVADAIRLSATANHVSAAGTSTPNLLLNALAASSSNAAPTTQTVAFKSMSGSAVRTSASAWRASVVVSVRNVANGAAVPYATVSASFAPGGSAQCTTGTAGSCTLTSPLLSQSSVWSTTFTGKGITGTNLRYDGSQNSVTQVVIRRP
ncbi:MAG: S8 family peptidase [Pseudomonadota bacterium]